MLKIYSSSVAYAHVLVFLLMGWYTCLIKDLIEYCKQKLNVNLIGQGWHQMSLLFLQIVTLSSRIS